MKNDLAFLTAEDHLSTMIHLYDMFHDDDGWPREINSLLKIRDWHSSWESAEWMGNGELRVIYDNGCREPLGFITLLEVNPSFCPHSLKVMEAGTFLVPRARGTGLNTIAKDHLYSRARDPYLANAVVHTVSSDNSRALTAMRKYDTEEITDPSANQPWSKLLRRKRFETGSQTIHLFIYLID